jgi:Fur family transcriptional regulator, ferric uptake regulator
MSAAAGETKAGVRSTRQRAAIARLLDTLDDFRSAQELHDELRRRGENIGLTTVYRTLQSMASAGMLDTLRNDTGESVYRRCSEHHHHHLVCRSCGSTVEVGDHEVEA